MSTTTLPDPVSPLLRLRLAPSLRLDDDQLLALCEQNRQLHIERSSEGVLEMMSPAGGKTADRNAELGMQLRMWARRDGRGRAFDSSGGFVLPNGAMRSPDAAWVELSRLRRLSPEEQEKFLPLCPDFVVELRSPSDALGTLQSKMDEYMANGCGLGWLVDPTEGRVHVYRPGVPPEILDGPDAVSAAPELDGFRLELGEIWHPSW